MGIFAKIAAGLRKTKDSFLGRLKRIFNSFTKIDEELFEELEEAIWAGEGGNKDALKALIKELRKKLTKESIENVFGIGYKLVIH